MLLPPRHEPALHPEPRLHERQQPRSSRSTRTAVAAPTTRTTCPRTKPHRVRRRRRRRRRGRGRRSSTSTATRSRTTSCPAGAAARKAPWARASATTGPAPTRCRVYPTFQPNCVFNWDGHNAFWPGRLLVDSTLHYPEDCCGEVHDSGHAVVLGAHRLLAPDRHAGDGPARARPPLRARHDAPPWRTPRTRSSSRTSTSTAARTCRRWCEVLGFWGFVNPADFVPIDRAHAAHRHREHRRTVRGRRRPSPRCSRSTRARPSVYWGVGAITDSLLMTPTANPNEYSASIPGPLSQRRRALLHLARDATRRRQPTHPRERAGELPHVPRRRRRDRRR